MGVKDRNTSIPTDDKDTIPNNAVHNKTAENADTPVDLRLVPSGHKKLFSMMKSNEGGDSDEERDKKKGIKYEPKAIRPLVGSRNTSFIGFKNNLDDGEFPKLSDPKGSLFSMSNTPKFLPNESDPQGFKANIFQKEAMKMNSFPRNYFMNNDERNVSNNSNISNGYLFHNIDYTPGSYKNAMNTSKPQELNFENFNMPAPNTSLAFNLMNSQGDRSQPFEKVVAKELERSVKLNLTVKSTSQPFEPTTREYDLLDRQLPIDLTAQKGMRLMIDVVDSGKISVRQVPINSISDDSSIHRNMSNIIDVSRLDAPDKAQDKCLPSIPDMYLSRCLRRVGSHDYR